MQKIQEKRSREDGEEEALKPPALRTRDCRRTQGVLDGLFKESEYGKKNEAFLPFFVEGTETDPQCRCGKLIREHPATSGPEKQAPLFIDGGAWPTQLSPPSKTEPSLDVSFVKTEAGKWCFEPDVAERMIRNKE